MSLFRELADEVLLCRSRGRRHAERQARYEGNH